MDINEDQIKHLAAQIKKGKLQKSRDPVAWSLLHNHGIDLKKERSKSIRSAKARARYQHSQLRNINESRQRNAVCSTPDSRNSQPEPPSTSLQTRFTQPRNSTKNYGGFLTRSQINSYKFEPTKYTPQKIKNYY